VVEIYHQNFNYIIYYGKKSQKTTPKGRNPF